MHPRSGDPAADRAGDPAAEQVRLLAERAKELDCLYAISRVLERVDVQTDPHFDTFVPTVLVTLCAAWQYPEVALATLVLHGQEYRSGPSASIVASQSCPIIAGGEIVGSLGMAYVAPRPPADEGPFLNEERQLLNVVGQRLGEFVERRRDQERLTIYQEKLRSLSAELSLSEERERRHIAQALHDRVGQVLALVNIKLGAALASVGEHEVVPVLRDVRRLVGEIIVDTRQLTFELSPPVLYELGLEAALEWLAETVGREYGLSVDCEFPTTPVQLDEVFRVVLFQCARELLANVCAHARARQAVIAVAHEAGQVCVTVSDDGVGMDTARLNRRGEAQGFGIFSIQERISDLGGSVRFISRAGRGLSVTLVLPLPDPPGETQPEPQGSAP